MSGKKHAFHEFRVVAGQLKGRPIKAPDLGITRPPLTRLRKAIFDFLNPYLENASYLDLFSGTGSYLFEAVSRGARAALGVEVEPILAEAINRQAEKYGVSDRLECLCEDVFEAIPKLASRGRRFDVIMIAPPQYQQLIDRTLVVLREHDVLTEDGMILCQHDTSETKKIDFLNWEIWQQRKYGNTTFTILR
ncbi:MAG: RsmD family RNA methyltransferase [Candidatus Zixiibacteriota bacterium]|nr:MAG: RsmD family RNA methyltransferase [candidate division Zixibacteria bacterium]